MEDIYDDLTIINYMIERAIAEKRIPEYLKQEYEGVVDINKFISDIYFSHEEFFTVVEEELMCYSGDDECDYIVNITGYSKEMIELVLWFEECFRMKMNCVTYVGKCKVCGCDELYIREDDELFTSSLQCSKCGEKYSYEDMDDVECNIDDFIAAHFGNKITIPPPNEGKITNKSYIFKVATGYRKGIWRKIQISTGATLDELSSEILCAFAFDQDHLYAFYMDEKGRKRNVPVYYSPQCDDTPRADSVFLDQLDLTPGSKFLYLYDFGDEWHFTVTLEQEVEEVTSEPYVIAVRGEAPEQYSSNW